MTTALALQDTQVLKQGTLPKTGEDFALVALSAKNLRQILALQDLAFASLTDEEQTFLLRKDEKFFEQHFSHGGAMLGVVHNGHLIAQSVVVNPSATHPKTGMVDMHLPAAPEKISVMQGVIVHPDYRGNKLMDEMVDAWFDQSQKNGRTEVIAEAALGNSYSWFVFMKRGMHLESIGVDPSDGTEVYNIHGQLPQLSEVFNKASRRGEVTVPQADAEAQKKLFAEGYKATGFTPASGNLTLQKNAKKKPCLPQP